MPRTLILLIYLLFPSLSHAFSLFDVFTVNATVAPAPHSYQQILYRAKNKGLNPEVLSLALKAYDNTLAEGRVRKPILTVIDYTKPSTEARLWVIDLNRQTVLFHELVAHGKNSGDLVPSKFSDSNGSLQSSLGVFVTESSQAEKVLEGDLDSFIDAFLRWSVEVGTQREV